MAKERSGYMYQEKISFDVVRYTDLKGKRQTVKRRASGQIQAQKIAEQILNELTSSGEKMRNVRTTPVFELSSCVRKEAGLLDVRFHALRHTPATRLVAAHVLISLGLDYCGTGEGYVPQAEERSGIKRDQAGLFKLAGSLQVRVLLR